MRDEDDSDPQSLDGPDAQPEAPAQGARLRYSDADFLRIVGDERRRSVGFGEGDTGELARVRIRAQEYRQGKIYDLPVIRGRSMAVDSTLSDAVDTLMPDVMEVFFGGDDVVTFDAESAEDEPQAREESEAVAWVVFSQNDAFRAFHDAIQDSLLNRTGLFHFLYAVGEPGLRRIADDVFRERLEKDGVDPLDRAVLFAAVRVGGATGYGKAGAWWRSMNFADPESGAYPVPPPFPREAAFAGAPFGLRPAPDWPEARSPAAFFSDARTQPRPKG